MKSFQLTAISLTLLAISTTSYAGLLSCNDPKVNNVVKEAINALNQKYSAPISQQDFTGSQPLYQSAGIFAHILDENTDIEPSKQCAGSSCSSIWNIIGSSFYPQRVTKDFAFTYIAQDLQPTYQIPLYNAYPEYSVVGLILDTRNLQANNIMCVYPLDATTAMRYKNDVACPCYFSM